MRSRFSAFVLGDAAYLLATWHESTRPDVLELDDSVRWLRLDIIDTFAGGLFDGEGVVEFMAHHKTGEDRGVLHERSTFVREAGAWFYVRGEVLQD